MEEKVTQQYYTSPRSTFGRVINVLGNSALVAGSVLGIIGCALVYGSIIRMDSSILFIIAFSLWAAGSVGHLLYDIVTLPVRRNKRIIPASIVSSVSMVASMTLMIVGAALTCGGIGEEDEYYNWSNGWDNAPGLSLDLKQAGAILWVIGSGILVGSIVFKLFSTVLNNMANVKKTSGVFTRIRAWTGGLSVVLMLMASIPMCIGSGIFVTVRSYDSRVATSLWIVGFSLFGIGAIFNMFHLSPLHTSPLESRPQQEFVETKYVVTESEIVTVNIRALIEKMEAESNNEQRLYQLLSFIGLGGQQYNYVEAMMLMNLFQWTSNKIEVLKALVHSRQLEMEPKNFAHLIASINPVHRSEVARLLFSKSMSINCNTALTILAQCENDESRFEMLTILAPHLHDEAHHWQIISCFNDQKCRQSVEDTLKKTAPSAPYV